ncbi:protein-L-isoaspartate(D-aspartate) O-methyltransferase [Teredinibacter sp. KSP-S5-2]|uniref:protein-L-isoaspartate(D-aspartate) O-methyltransferase n=1 Tax=Teredinibacter sp. KSP-S5-2 TaxID=3034506 RepID=UPI002934DB2D|nr:protein-L-isoaspartate(D-aspartate) O-methyltransferase [Teredinibacter sp. KSP-S5-2]WNO10136.1 protein-L-isoaspartate(D-aspartate) O-methyltransferase [Teredinibacter sp. KSP-S5-2]
MSYDNRPLPIGYGQTISQPFIVALMTQYLDINSDDIILEIGTGCGYQAAILGELAKRVYSIEIIPTLAESARQRLQDLGYTNIEVYSQDGHLGLDDYSPYDSIIVTATGKTIPKALIKQLKQGGKMILPIGGEYETQYLTLVEKKSGNRIEKLRSIPVRFVPLTHD